MNSKNLRFFFFFLNILDSFSYILNPVNFSLRPYKDFHSIDYGNLISFMNKSRVFCLNECRKKKSCSIVRIENNICSLHSIYFFNNNKIIKSSNKSLLYQKSLIKDNCNPNPCLNFGACLNEDYGFVCVCSQGYTGKNCSIPIENFNICSNNSYWSINQNKCINCPQNFIKYYQIPFSCYYVNQSSNRNFTFAKTFCETLTNGSHLLRPKSITERNYFWSLFPNHSIWVDSFISFLGEFFTWGDGDAIYGFDNNEPDNSFNGTSLKENALFLRNSTFRDSSDKSLYRVVCQYSV